MTKMLASVADLAEAEIAVTGGADIIDLKDPKAGALGAAATETIRQAVQKIAGRRETSAVCGDLPMEPETIRAKAEEVAATDVDYVKIGFFPSANVAACAEALAPLGKRTKLIAVLFADKEPDFGLLDVFARHGFHGAMVDTADKTRGRLLDHLPPERIPGFVDRARSLGLKVGLSGSLETPDIPRLLPLAPDFLGFRGALCDRSQRTASINKEAVEHIRKHTPGFRIEDVPLDDARTFEILNRGETMGVFQLESGGMVETCRKYDIQSIDDIIDLIAVYRPGAMQFIDQMLDVKKGRKKPMLKPASQPENTQDAIPGRGKKGVTR